VFADPASASTTGYVQSKFEVGQFQDFAMPYVSEVASRH
jgi:hypothetical protein